jgi:vitamin B12 transporter
VQSIDWNNEIVMSPNLRFTVGGNQQWQSLNSDDGFGTLDNFSRRANSFYGGLETELKDKHQLQLNIRHDSTEKNDSADTGLIGYGYKINKQFKFTASAATGFSVPALGFAFGAFGNPDLKPEYSQTYETGLQYFSDTSLIRISMFQSKITNQIEFGSTNFINVGRAVNEGIELSASQEIFGWTARSSLTLQDPRNDLTGERLRRRAAVLGSVSASRNFGLWRLGGDLSYTGSRPDGVDNLSQYWLAGITSRYQFSKSYSAFARIDNLFNENYQTAFGFNQPSRGLFVGLNWQQ